MRTGTPSTVLFAAADPAPRDRLRRGVASCRRQPLTARFALVGGLIGQTVVPIEDLKAALAGHLIAGFDAPEHAAFASERALGLPLLEVHDPIHSIGRTQPSFGRT